MLIKLSGEKKDDWDEFIDAALFSYRYFFSCLLLNMIIVLYYCFRTSRHASSKFTPFQLLYKRSLIYQRIFCWNLITQRKVKTAASELKLLHKIMHMTNNYNFTISNSHAHLAYFSSFCYSYLVFCHFELISLDL